MIEIIDDRENRYKNNLFTIYKFYNYLGKRKNGEIRIRISIKSVSNN